MTGDGNDQRRGRTALVLYASETGNSQDVAEELGRMAERLHFVTTVREMDAVEINSLINYSIVVFVVSTTGQGEFPRNSRKFWKSLLRKRLPPACLNHLSFTTFGLGDSSYPQFNWAARKLHRRLEQLDAKIIYPPGEADEQHEEGIDGTFLPWSIGLRKHLLTLYPLPDGLTPIPRQVLLPPKFTLKILDTPSEQDSRERPISLDQDISTQGLESRINIISPAKSPLDDSKMLYLPPLEPHAPATGPQIKDHLDNEIDPVPVFLPPHECLPIPDTFRIKLVENKRVTPLNHWQDVRLLTFHMEAENLYEPGDTITIFPKNFPEDVQYLIDLMDWNMVADKPLKLEATTPDYFIDPFFTTRPTGLYPLNNTTLRDLLIHNLDINAIPKPYFFQYISFYTDDPTHKERLLEFGDSAYRDEYYDYATRPKRSMLEVLADFPSVKLPFNDVASVFPVIRGRQFSICSGGLGKQISRTSTAEEDHLVKVQLLVAIVKYKTVLRKIRQGLCSRYIAALEPDTFLNVKLNANESFYYMPAASPELPIIMVAAGTGIAPCRSLIWERAKTMSVRDLCSEEPPIGPNILIYGGRNKNADFFFKDEWTSAALRTEVMTAFSRDQKEKIYVQDVIRREGKKLVEHMMSQGLVYVCGSSGNMPKAVKEAFLRALVEHGSDGAGLAREDAERFLERMERGKFYIQETW